MCVSLCRSLCTIAALWGAVALVVPVGALARPHRHSATHITITRWSGETLGGVSYNVTPEQTVTHCASDLEKSITVSGPVNYVVENRKILVQFLLDGTVRDTFHEHWTKTGRATFTDSIYNDSGLPDGRWTLKVQQGGRTIGLSWIVLAADPTC